MRYYWVIAGFGLKIKMEPERNWMRASVLPMMRFLSWKRVSKLSLPMMDASEDRRRFNNNNL